jgi:amino acid permease
MIGLMIKSQLGLGVLSLPACFDVLGLIPGIICIISIAIMTTWANYVVGVFKRNHREVYGIEGAGQLMFGAIGREFLGGAYIICE